MHLHDPESGHLFRPGLDGKLVTGTPAAAYRAGRQAKVPIIVRRQWRGPRPQPRVRPGLLLAPLGDRKAALAAYDPEGPARSPPSAAGSAWIQAHAGAGPLRRGRFAKQGVPAYEYRFDYLGEALRGRRGWPTRLGNPYVFDTYGPGYIAMVAEGSPERPARRTLRWPRPSGLLGQLRQDWRPQRPRPAALAEVRPGQDQIMVFRTDGAAAATADPLKPRLDIIAASRK